MAPERCVYYILLVIAFAISYIRSKSHKAFVIIYWLFLFSILSESVSDYFRYANEAWRYSPYHFYIPIEYSLVTFYFSSQLRIDWLKKTLPWTIPVFILYSIFISIFVQGLEEFPSWQYNVDGTLIIVWCVISLFTLPVNPEATIYRTFQFWFCIAFMLLFSGQFFMNGFFNPLQESNPGITKKLIFMVYYILNYLFYTLIIFGLLCSRQTTKYTSQ